MTHDTGHVLGILHEAAQLRMRGDTKNTQRKVALHSARNGMHLNSQAQSARQASDLLICAAATGPAILLPHAAQAAATRCPSNAQALHRLLCTSDICDRCGASVTATACQALVRHVRVAPGVQPV